ncbi:MAG: sodium:calcium antiporter [Planctomycetes bacterium]|jgi:cation:H+ antiporter|nr:sodium:calcium antiporter [Planctomycetota bacterium]
MNHFILWSQFSIAAIMIIVAGYKLTRYGDVFSEKFKLGHVFIGSVLIGWCTSLPELVLSIGTVSFAHPPAPSISMGNVLGSNLFNIFIIVFLDIIYWKGPILRKAEPNVKLSVWFSLGMAVLMGFALFFQCKGEVPYLRLGYDAALLFLVYIIATMVMYYADKKSEVSVEEAPIPDKYTSITIPGLLVRCAIVMVIIVAAGLWMSTLAPKVAEVYGLGQSFVGSFFVAIVTSLPEVVTSIIAVRLGFPNMAFGTIFGSNIFNLTIVAICDIFYQGGELGNNLIANIPASEYYAAIFFLLAMTILVILTLTFCKSEGRKFFIGIESIFLAIFYVLAMYCMYNPNFIHSLWKF